jgi:hypothetical protein
MAGEAVNKLLSLALALCIAASATSVAAPAAAHEDDYEGGIHAENTADGNRAQGSVVVKGTVRDLRGLLYRVDSWNRVFTDVRSVQHKSGATWSVDFTRFGHPHDFAVRRTPRGVVLELAEKNHGVGRIEYALEPVDRERSRLVIRLHLGTPPGFTPEQMLTLLREKLRVDLDDFEKTTQKGNAR